MKKMKDQLWDKLLKIVGDKYPLELVKYVLPKKKVKVCGKYEQEKVTIEFQIADINFWIMDGKVKKLLNIEPYSIWDSKIPKLVFTRNAILTKTLNYKYEVVSVVLLLEKNIRSGDYAVTCAEETINRFVFPVVSLENLPEILHSCTPLVPFIIKVDQSYEKQVIETVKHDKTLQALTVLVISRIHKISQKEALDMTGIKLDEWRQALLEVPAMQELAKEWEEQGEMKSLKSVAKAMLAKKMDVTLIAELTGLSKDEIKKMR